MGQSIARLGAGCAGILAGLGLATAPALAARVAAHSTVTAQSEYLGGYDVVPPVGISSIGARFKLPSISCPATAVAQLVSLGEAINNATGDFYQPGGATDALSGGALECEYGTAMYGIDADTAAGGEHAQFTDVNPGDMIQTQVQELPSGQALATTTDLTTGAQVTSKGTSTGDEAQIYEGIIPDVSDETVQNSFTIPKFKSVQFSRSQAGGVPLAEVDPTATDLAQTGPIMVAAGAINPKTPGRFTLTEKSDQ